MDDRDKDLTGLFVRDLDEIALPPRGAWRRAPGRENTAMRASRYLLTAGAVVAVLVIALVVGLQLNQRQETAAGPSASPTPSATGAPIVQAPSPTAGSSATPAPSATASVSPPASGGIYNDDFGFAVFDVNRVETSIRKESSDARVATIQGQAVAVSPDGRQIAYFTSSQLRVASAANPASVTFSSSLNANERGGGIAWSDDGANLLYSVNTGQPPAEERDE